jgi:hypothetical protein
MCGASTNAMQNPDNLLKIGALIGALLSWPAAALADMQVPQFRVGQQLTTAHHQLLGQGWSVSNQAFNSIAVHPEHRHLKTQLPSLITCSGTGPGLCAYGYSRQGQALRLIAQPNGALVRWLHDK